MTKDENMLAFAPQTKLNPSVEKHFSHVDSHSIIQVKHGLKKNKKKNQKTNLWNILLLDYHRNLKKVWANKPTPQKTVGQKIPPSAHTVTHRPATGYYRSAIAYINTPSKPTIYGHYPSPATSFPTGFSVSGGPSPAGCLLRRLLAGGGLRVRL